MGQEPFDVQRCDVGLRIKPEGDGYYLVYLPDSIEELDLSERDLIREEKEGQEGAIPYLRLEKCGYEEKLVDNDYRLQEDSSYLVTIRSEWQDDFVKYNGKERLVAEVNFIEEVPHIRIYRSEDYYSRRLQELRDKGYEPDVGDRVPIALGIGTLENADDSPEVKDFASDTPFPGQKFRLVPYDAQHEVFQKRMFRTLTGTATPDSTVFQDVVEEGELPRCQPDLLNVEWMPPPGADLPFTPENYVEDRHLLYTSRDVDGVEVVLPEKDRFSISTETAHGKQGTLITYTGNEETEENSVINGWKGSYLEKTAEDCITAYIPARP